MKENFDLIDRYFDNSLSPKEQFAFNSLLQTDEEFKSEFLFRKDLKKVLAVQQRDELKESLKAIEQKASMSSKLAIIPKKWLVAASFALILSLGIWSVKSFFFPPHSAIYQEYFQTSRNTVQPIVRGENVQTIEYRAFVAYEAENYHKAINLFNSVDNPHVAYIEFYKAMCYLSLDKTSEAIPLLESVAYSSNLSGKSSGFDEKSAWYLGLAYLDLNDTEKAIAQFSKIANGSESQFKFKESKEILEFID